MLDGNVFGERLKNTRRRMKKTQDDMAIALDISRPSYIQYEKGKNYPLLNNTIKIAIELNISIDYLVGLTDEPRKIKLK